MDSVHYDLPALRALCSLERARSFSEAAFALALTPSAFSRRIAKLEQLVGEPLVTRTTRTMLLTAAGVQLAARARPLIAALDEAVAESARAARDGTQEIAVGCASFLAYTLLPYALREFRRSFPDTRIRLIDAQSRRIAAAVESREVEIAVLTHIDPGPHLVIEPIATDDFVLVCPPDHPLAAAGEIAWRDLSSHRLLGLAAETGTRRLLERELKRAGVDVIWFDEVRSLSSLIGYLRSGSFAAPVSRLLSAHIPDVATVELREPRVERQISLVRRDETKLGAAGRALWDALRESARKVAGRTPPQTSA